MDKLQNVDDTKGTKAMAIASIAAGGYAVYSGFQKKGKKKTQDMTLGAILIAIGLVSVNRSSK